MSMNATKTGSEDAPRNFTINFGPQHPAAHRMSGLPDMRQRKTVRL